MILKSKFRLLDVHEYIDPWRSTRQVRSCKLHELSAVSHLCPLWLKEFNCSARHSHEACYSAVPLSPESYPVTASAPFASFG